MSMEATLIAPDQLAALQAAEPVVVIDTRDADTFAAGHVPGAVNLREVFTFLATSTPEGLKATFADALGQAGLSGAKTAVFCEDAMNSGDGQSCRGHYLLTWLGYPRIKVLNGGFSAWKAAGFSDVRMYFGSGNGWSRDPSLPIETGLPLAATANKPQLAMATRTRRAAMARFPAIHVFSVIQPHPPETTMSSTYTATLDPVAPTTVKAHLRPIDGKGLAEFAAGGKANPARRGTNKVHTVMEGQYRSLSHVGEKHTVVVDEPLHLFGEDTAPAPGEIVLSGLGGCIAVGVTAVATWKGVKLSKLEVFLEGDIGNPAAWGAGGALEKTPPEMGFQAIRVKVLVEGDASREVLDDIVQHANFYSPVANTMRNPIPFEISMV